MAKVELDVAEMVEETFEKHFGVTLARLRELAEADKDGRGVVLPCKAEAALSDMRFAYVNKDPGTSHQFEEDALKAAADILGEWPPKEGE